MFPVAGKWTGCAAGQTGNCDNAARDNATSWDAFCACDKSYAIGRNAGNTANVDGTKATVFGTNCDNC